VRQSAVDGDNRDFAISHPESNPSNLVGPQPHLPRIQSLFAKSLMFRGRR